MTTYKKVVLQARRPGGEWGTRSVLSEENYRQSLPEDHRDFLTVDQVRSLGMEKAVKWQQAVRDDTEYRVVTL